MPIWLWIPGCLALGEWSHHRDYLSREDLFCSSMYSCQNIGFWIPKSRHKVEFHPISDKEFLCCSVQFSSVAQSCPTLCDTMNRSMPGLPVHHHLPEFTQTHVHLVRDAIQPSHLQSYTSPPAPNPSQHQSLFQWVNFSHEVAKVLEFQL